MVASLSGRAACGAEVCADGLIVVEECSASAEHDLAGAGFGVAPEGCLGDLVAVAEVVDGVAGCELAQGDGAGPDARLLAVVEPQEDRLPGEGVGGQEAALGEPGEGVVVALAFADLAAESFDGGAATVLGLVETLCFCLGVEFVAFGLEFVVVGDQCLHVAVEVVDEPVDGLRDEGVGDEVGVVEHVLERCLAASDEGVAVGGEECRQRGLELVGDAACIFAEANPGGEVVGKVFFAGTEDEGVEVRSQECFVVEQEPWVRRSCPR